MLKLKNYNKSIANAVGVDAYSDPHFEEPTLKTPKAYSNQDLKKYIIAGGQSRPPLQTSDYRGITLIALIITIIVMLILVGVTINVALNGGLFEKAQKATYQTGASEIQEQVEVEKAIKIAENNEKVPENYNIQIEDLDISKELKNKFKNKLIISNGTLYYDGDVVTDLIEQGWLEEIGIYKFEENIPIEIHLGDTLKNVTFKEGLSETELNYAGTVQIILINDESKGMYMINLGSTSPDYDPNELFFGLMCATYEPQTLTLVQYFLPEAISTDPSSSSGMTRFGNTDWYYGTLVGNETDISWPINGVVVGIIDSTSSKWGVCEGAEETGFAGNIKYQRRKSRL